MTAILRPYTGEPGFTEDFHRVRDFLVRINEPWAVKPGFHWGRWEWAFSLPYQDAGSLAHMGVFEDGGRVAGLAAYENGLGWAWLCCDPAYDSLKPELLLYAREHLCHEGKVRVLIDDGDLPLQQFAFARGFRPTEHKEQTAVLGISPETTAYMLPEGFRVTSLADDFDMAKYSAVLWKGFDHEKEGPVPLDEASLAERRRSVSGPHVNLNLNVAAVAPDGAFVSYCGMWYEPGTENALVEPVATDPKYRRMGLGRAAVLEAVRRCGRLGAKRAYVGSSQQFYYGIGFYPVSNETFWECNV